MVSWILHTLCFVSVIVHPFIILWLGDCIYRDISKLGLLQHRSHFFEKIAIFQGVYGMWFYTAVDVGITRPICMSLVNYVPRRQTNPTECLPLDKEFNQGFVKVLGGSSQLVSG